MLSLVASCAGEQASHGSTTPSTTSSTSSTSLTTPITTPRTTATIVSSDQFGRFPVAAFAALGTKPVSDELAAALQGVLDRSADGHGLTAAVISPKGIWSGASGMALEERPMVPEDQLAIMSITKTIVAAQVMQLIEAGVLGLDDLAADRLPPDLNFDTNGARIIDLLSMRSGIPEFFADPDAVSNDPSHVWTTEERLATVAPERGQAGQDWEYVGTNYLLLGSIIEHLTGQSVAEALRSGVLAGDEYERLIYQPDERPTEPTARTVDSYASAEAFENGGGYLPSLAVATLFGTDGAMASDSTSVAIWFKQLCAGQVVSPATVDEMTDFDERPGYGLGVIDRSTEYWPGSGAFGHKGGNATVALCFQDPAIVVVVLANADHDVDTVAGALAQAATI